MPSISPYSSAPIDKVNISIGYIILSSLFALFYLFNIFLDVYLHKNMWEKHQSIMV